MSGTTDRAGSSGRSQRFVAQRERILDAALACFIEHGFHGASMSDLARAAGMSQGLIYRYFESKADIVIAIVEQQLEASRLTVRALAPGQDMLDTLVECFALWRDNSAPSISAGLFAEISAESARNPAVATALAASDREMSAELALWVMRRASGDRAQHLAGGTAQSAGRRLLMLFQMVMTRALRDPACPRDELANDLRPLVAAILGDVDRILLRP